MTEQQLSVQPARETGLALASISIEELVGQVQLIQAAMKAVMRENEHYGVIPGTGRKDPETGKEIGKPTLLKPGAEKLCFLFRLAPSYETIETDRGDGHKAFQVRCRLHHINSGALVAEGVGICSTMEAKYRYRTEVLKDDHGQPIPVPGNYWGDRNPEKLVPGGGRQFSPRKIDGKWVITHKVEHDNPHDYHNTVIKMACKRALVAATLNATAASDIFTQDLEDAPEEVQMAQEEPRQPARRRQEAPKQEQPKAKQEPEAPKEPEPPKATKGNDSMKNGGESVRLTGVVTKCRPSEFDGRTFYWAEINDRVIFTAEQQIGKDLLDADGQFIEAMVRQGQKPGRWVLLDFHYPQPDSESK